MLIRLHRSSILCVVCVSTCKLRRVDTQSWRSAIFLSENTYTPQVKLFVHLYHLRMLLYSESRFFLAECKPVESPD